MKKCSHPKCNWSPTGEVDESNKQASSYKATLNHKIEAHGGQLAPGGYKQ